MLFNSMDKQIVISLNQISKKYQLFSKKSHRFYESIDPFKRKYHKEFFSLKNINLNIYKGEILGIIGTNGAGKSTLLKIISGVLTPSSGKLEVSGNVVALLELGSGFNPELTGLENIFFYCSVIGVGKKKINEQIESIIQFANIGDFIHQPLKIYSSGMKARLAFAASVHVNPDILILDEVLAVGDDLFRRKCYARMEEFFKSGKTILFASHDANSINQLCTRAILLDKGECILNGPPKMVTMYYQKMLYSRKEQQSAIIEEIKEINSNIARKENFDEMSGEILQTEIDNEMNDFLTREDLINKPALGSVLKPYYLPEFVSKSVVEYRNYDVSISDIRILTEDGTCVNVLVHGEKYYLRYKVIFNVTLDAIQFTNSIKTEKGQNIAGFAYPDKDKYIEKQILEGTVVTYKMLFDCLLTGGKNYYLNIGLRTFAGAESIIVNRIVDACIFRVISDNRNNGGLVSLNQKVFIS